MKNLEAVELLINRNSMKMVVAPAPSDEELALALQAAVAAPDHGNLTPWRFKLIRGENIQKFADLGITIRQRSDNPFPEEKVAASRQWLSEVPLIIAVACHIDYSNTKIPESERMLSAGCAVMNMMNALNALGYGTFWSTGIATYDDEFQAALGFDSLDYRFMGFLAVGTPKVAIPKKERKSYTVFVEEWTGE
ncbi:nitroreductase family protein [Pelistega suis]|uniref:nitroreductase family protein n=1 Tax=Pelistega suis TaxID=1631957 RepID=UPI00211D0CE4|nr:nitroreductase [Pelistega suis]MCQ9328732.1 nitroreductase [Pelistega suis]